MDDQNLNTGSQNNWRGLINRKNILIILGVIIFAEILWAGWILFKTNAQVGQTIIPPVETKPLPTEIELQTDKTSVKAGEKFRVLVLISSERSTDGADLIISYDPKLLSASPFVLGTLYNEYPVNKVDEKAGKITVSGISTGTEGVKPEGAFGSVVFSAKASGVATISLDFAPGSTADTNVTEKGTGEDILEAVKNINITINP